MEKVKNILNAFTTANVPVVLVGGSIRDMLLNRDSVDIDLATPLSPTEVKVAIENQPWCKSVIPTGIEHGTVTVVMTDGTILEVTQYRVDIQCDGRHAEVLPTSRLTEDLARRDLTINAIAWDGKSFTDPFGGKDDIKDRVLRCVGDPAKRFEEDYLRVIRTFRFEAKLGFKIEAKTLDAALNSNIARKIDIEGGNEEFPVKLERVIMEFDKVFGDSNADCEKFLHRMWDIGVIQVMLPELNAGPLPCNELTQSPEYHPEGDVWTHMAKVVNNVEGSDLVTARWIAMLHDIAKPITAKIRKDPWYSYWKHDKVGASMIPTIGKRLKLPKRTIELATTCTRWHIYIYQAKPTSKNVRKVQVDVGKDNLRYLKQLAQADHMGRPVSQDVEAFVTPVAEELTPILMGKHLVEKGHKPGPEFGNILRNAHKHQLATGEDNIDKLYKQAISM
tara:strand:+ start:899 stop:2239 length:1341 start_codon:yes stop_codon:yes gene_type:complete